MHSNFNKITKKIYLDPNPSRVFEGGRRLMGVKRTSSNNNPLISIITVVKNNVSCIEETIQSIQNQKYQNIEYIIIDGLSSDGTLDIIKKINHIDYAISEKDLGNYDAINKGLSLCTGDLIGIVNGDDILLPEATSILVNYFNEFPEIDFLFGSVKKHWGILSGYNPKKIKYSWFFYTSHSTGFFIKRKAAEINGKYSLKYQYSSDFDYFYRMIVHNKFKGMATKRRDIWNFLDLVVYQRPLIKKNIFLKKYKLDSIMVKINFFY